MKKLFLMLIMCLAMAGCNNSQKNADAVETQSKVEFSQQDFCLYGEPDEMGNSDVVAWIGMSEDKVNLEDEYFNSYYMGFNGGKGIKFATGNDGAGAPIKLVNYLNYTGAGKSVLTSKGIVTYGYEFRNSDYVSTVGEVIANYGIDPENESVYANYTDDNNCVIALYFNIDKDNNVTRIVSPLDTDVSDIKALNADYSIKFIIIDEYVCSIQMYRDHDKVNLG